MADAEGSAQRRFFLFRCNRIQISMAIAIRFLRNSALKFNGIIKGGQNQPAFSESAKSGVPVIQHGIDNGHGRAVMPAFILADGHHGFPKRTDMAQTKPGRRYSKPAVFHPFRRRPGEIAMLAARITENYPRLFYFFNPHSNHLYFPCRFCYNVFGNIPTRFEVFIYHKPITRQKNAQCLQGTKSSTNVF